MKKAFIGVILFFYVGLVNGQQIVINDKLEALARELNDTFDVKKRGELAVQMQQTVLDDDAFIFFSHLKMSMITKDTVVGLTAHPTDFYEITAKLAPAPAKQ
jgi:peptide/nickel transport system substrate-binding protein